MLKKHHPERRSEIRNGATGEPEEGAKCTGVIPTAMAAVAPVADQIQAGVGTQMPFALENTELNFSKPWPPRQREFTSFSSAIV